MIVLP